MSQPSLLLIDDDPAFLRALGRLLRGDYALRTALSAADVLRQLSPPPDVVLLDLRLNAGDDSNQDGLTLLDSLHQQYPDIPIVMITGYPDLEIAVEAMRRGAVDFLQKASLSVSEIKARVDRALEQGRLARRVAELEQQISRVEPRRIVGVSPGVQEIRRVIGAVGRDGSVTVLLRGETGTGKELIARAIHAGGRRKAGPFVPVMLNAIPQAMAEAELFGYEAGAFTDARARRIGYLEKAHGGVLFLDEIGEADPQVQGKMLRFLEEREFQRLGSTEPVCLDVQIIAATNADLEARVQNGQFREDLYFRLKVHEITLPPLRERTEDVGPIIEHFLILFRQQGKRVEAIAPNALAVLRSYAWPGNIRQLRNTLESAIFQAQMQGRSQIDVGDLPADVRAMSVASRVAPIPGGPVLNPAAPGDGFDLDEALGREEFRYVAAALDTAQGKKSEAWRLLGLNDRFALRRRVRRLLEQYPHFAQEFPDIKTKYG